MEVWVVGAATPHQTRLQKKVYHEEVRTILVTSIKLYCKNYLKFSYTLNSPTSWSRKSLTVLAIARSYFIGNYFKKRLSGVYYSFFATLTMPVSVSIVHSNFSPLDTFKKSLANAGIVVVKDPATDCIFVSYFIFIPLIYWILYINSYISLFTYIYIYLYILIYRNLYILIS